MGLLPRVSENLRRQWAQQRAQMLEEREFTQSGRPRDELSIMEVDHDVRVMDYLLSLPLRAQFDSVAISRAVREAETLNNLRQRPSE